MIRALGDDFEIMDVAAGAVRLASLAAVAEGGTVSRVRVGEEVVDRVIAALRGATIRAGS